MKTCSRLVRAFTLLIALTGVVTATGQTLHLDAEAAARMAEEASPLAAAAEARLEAANLGVETADAARLPVLAAQAALNRRSAVPELSVPLAGPGAPPRTIFPNIPTTYVAELALSQPLYAGGAIEAGREAARRNLDAASSARRRTTLDLRFRARSAYWLAVATDAGLVAARAEERRASRLLDDARALREVGMAVEADVLAAEARLAGARLEVIRADTEVRDAVARLRSLLAVAADTTIELADIGTDAVPPAPAEQPELESQALGGRPELAELDARIAALEARQRTVEAARRPEVALQGAWDLARPNPRFLPLEDAWNDSWSVGVTAGWTLFDGRRTRSRAAEVRAEAEALRADRAEASRQISLDVETSRLGLEAALDAVGAADAARDAARAREEAARERYQAGVAQIWEMLDAQAELADAERSQIRTRATAWIASAALERAVGR